MDNNNIDGFEVMARNHVTMTLGEFLKYREALKFQEEMREFAMNSRKVYGNADERDLYDIGNAVLTMLNIPLKIEDEEADGND